MSDYPAGNIDGLLKKSLPWLILALLLTSVQLPVLAAWQQQQRDIMGTRVSVDLWHGDNDVAATCSARVFSEMDRIDALMSTYRDSSEVSYINLNASIEAVSVSEELMHLLRRSIYFSKISAGAFDITYASIGYAYDYRKQQRPSDQVVAQKLPAIDYRHIELQDRKIRFNNSAVRIDFGGIAKGYAVDRAIDILQHCGISKAMVSAGGDSRIIGDREGRPWVIGIRHPRDSQEIALRLPLSDSAISTSGDYERFYIENGKRVHHIINPRTGRSASGSWSATVIGPDAMTTDALSTTIFILGAVEGLALVESLDGIDAIIIDSNGKVHYSSGFQEPEN
ncbi:MAG: FAD:protein FMN transferase [Gammaproteobacteria bacterium]|nr:FAD:protein FMN transferase [Gammaproteobacteria bacterium]